MVPDAKMEMSECLSVVSLTWVARRHPQEQPSGSCSQEEARQRDTSQVLSVGPWTQGSPSPGPWESGGLLSAHAVLPQWATSPSSCLCSLEGGPSEEPQLGGAATGFFAFAGVALDFKSWGP